MNPATLAILIERARSRSDAAQARHANVRRALEQSRAHLTMLQQYAGEYDDRARPRTGEDRDPSADRNQVAFQARLKVAVETQAREVALREAAVKASGDELALCLRKCKSLETLEQRRREQERLRDARRDQKNTDEIAQRTRDRAARGDVHDAAARGES